MHMNTPFLERVFRRIFKIVKPRPPPNGILAAGVYPRHLLRYLDGGAIDRVLLY